MKKEIQPITSEGPARHPARAPMPGNTVVLARQILIALVTGTGAQPLNPGNPIHEAFEYARMFEKEAADFLRRAREEGQ